MLLKIISVLLALILGTFSACAESTKLFMINVGKGDAIIVQAEGRNYLIDAGKAEQWDTIYAALKDHGIVKLDGVFMTHTDKDHSGGLKKLAKSKIRVMKWYAPEFSTAATEDNPVVKAAEKADAEVNWLKAGDYVDGIFKVLAPLSPDDQNEDNNSLVMMLETAYGRVLFAGDMERGEEKELVKSGADLQCDVLKVPNHADDDACMAGMIENTGAAYALISTDPYDKPGTPDEFLMSRLENLGMSIYRTDFTEKGICVEMNENGITVTEK